MPVESPLVGLPSPLDGAPSGGDVGSTSAPEVGVGESASNWAVRSVGSGSGVVVMASTALLSCWLAAELDLDPL